MNGSTRSQLSYLLLGGIALVIVGLLALVLIATMGKLDDFLMVMGAVLFFMVGFAFLGVHYVERIRKKQISRPERTKGVVLVRCENDKKETLSKATYLRMIKSGRKVVLLKEGLHWEDLL